MCAIELKKQIDLPIMVLYQEELLIWKLGF